MKIERLKKELWQTGLFDQLLVEDLLDDPAGNSGKAAAVFEFYSKNNGKAARKLFEEYLKEYNSTAPRDLVSREDLLGLALVSLCYTDLQNKKAPNRSRLAGMKDEYEIWQKELIGRVPRITERIEKKTADLAAGYQNLESEEERLRADLKEHSSFKVAVKTGREGVRNLILNLFLENLDEYSGLQADWTAVERVIDRVLEEA